MSLNPTPISKSFACKEVEILVPLSLIPSLCITSSKSMNLWTVRYFLLLEISYECQNFLQVYNRQWDEGSNPLYIQMYCHVSLHFLLVNKQNPFPNPLNQGDIL